MTDDVNKFSEDLSGDCFIECDELLIIIRRNLLKLEENTGGEESPMPLLEELLRSCHTLKGLTGMLGASQTMQLTHSLENYLKASFEGLVSIKPAVLDTLFSGINMLEQQLSAMHAGSEVPDAGTVMGAIEGLLPSHELEKVKEKSTAQVLTGSSLMEKDSDSELDKAFEQGMNVWKFTFSPTRELFDKGVNINEVRNRIQQVGSILQASPSAGADGTISFTFTVSTNQSEESFSGLNEFGLQYEAVARKPVSGQSGPAATSFHIRKESPVLHANTIKVDLARLDDLMRMVGDLVISRARLNDSLLALFPKTTSGESRSLQETNNLMERQLRDLREGVMRLRLVPVGEVFERMKFVVRDLIRESGKSISLEISGQETQIDKFVVEKMLDPLLHLVRNAVSHGIESMEERLALGKPEQGTLTLRAATAGDGVIIDIEDDGRGVDKEKVTELAIRRGLIEPGVMPDEETLLQILCSSGFSTREGTDMVSGRGVGMNVVKQTISELGGTMNLSSAPGQGSNFQITLPLTLSIVEALIVKVNNQVFAVPMPVVNEVIHFGEADLVKMEKNELISYRETVLPIIKLNSFFGLGTNGSDRFDTLVVGKDKELAGLAVDKIIGQREIVVRSLPDPLVKVDGVNGATELGEGKVVLILDVPSLLRSATRQKQTIIKQHVTPLA